MKLPVMIFVVFCVTVLMALEDLGPLKIAQKKYPQIFQTGSVNIVTINKIPCYVFSGDAEQAFSGDFAESESELYEEATLAAKSNFYEFLSKKNKNSTVSMSGCSVLYQFNDKTLYTVILYVPQSNVVIQLKKSDIVAPPLKKVPEKVTAPDSPMEPSVAVKKQPSEPTEKKVALKAQISKQSNVVIQSKKSDTVAPPLKKAPEKVTAPDSPMEPSVAVKEQPSEPTEKKVALKAQISKQSYAERRISKFQKRIKNNPNDIIALITLGDIYKKNGKFSDAANFYSAALKCIEKDKFFDEAEKIRVIYDTASLFEKINKYNMALKYYHYLLRHRCSPDQKKHAVAAISRLRLKTLD